MVWGDLKSPHKKIMVAWQRKFRISQRAAQLETDPKMVPRCNYSILEIMGYREKRERGGGASFEKYEGTSVHYFYAMDPPAPPSPVSPAPCIFAWWHLNMKMMYNVLIIIHSLFQFFWGIFVLYFWSLNLDYYYFIMLE